MCFCCKSCGCFNLSIVLLIIFIFKKEIKMKIYVILASLFLFNQAGGVAMHEKLF